MVSWGYLLWNSLGLFIQRYASGTSSEHKWINLHRFWIHLLLLFALTSGVMRNDLFPFKIIIPTPYCYQKKTLTEMTTGRHSLSLVVIYRYSLFHSLSLVAIPRTHRCHSLSLDVSLVCPFINDPKKKRDSIMADCFGGQAILQTSPDYLVGCLFV